MELILKTLLCLLGVLPATVVTAIAFITNTILGTLVSLFFLAILVLTAVFYLNQGVKKGN